MLTAYLLQTGGSYEDFGAISGVLLREDFVQNVLFTPKDIVSVALDFPAVLSGSSIQRVNEQGFTHKIEIEILP